MALRDRSIVESTEHRSVALRKTKNSSIALGNRSLVEPDQESVDTAAHRSFARATIGTSHMCALATIGRSNNHRSIAQRYRLILRLRNCPAIDCAPLPTNAWFGLTIDRSCSVIDGFFVLPTVDLTRRPLLSLLG